MSLLTSAMYYLTWLIMVVTTVVNIRAIRRNTAFLRQMQRTLTLKDAALAKGLGFIQSWRQHAVYHGPLDSDPVQELIGEMWTALRA